MMKRIAFLALWALFLPMLAWAQASGAAHDYVLGAGDVLHISVYQNPDLSMDTRISESGSISYPLLGTVPLKGLTVGQAERRIEDGLRNGNFVKQPQVTIVITQVNGNMVSVLGQVNKPGRYPLAQAENRLTDMLATAGGIAPTGADTVVVVGTRDGKAFRKEIDLPSVFSADRKTPDFLLQNGDEIWVDRAPLIYIYGEVQRPGALPLMRHMTLIQALASGGGLTLRGTEKGITVHRRDANGVIQVLRPSMDDELQDGDVIYVRESLF